MDGLEYTRIGLRALTFITLLYVLYSFKSYVASDMIFDIAFWVYAAVHAAYVIVQSYKEYEDSI
jgi:hypothetical protein